MPGATSKSDNVYAPAKINGFWYVAYNSSVAWGHFEAKP
jgi:hypothetical protein